MVRIFVCYGFKYMGTLILLGILVVSLAIVLFCIGSTEDNELAVYFGLMCITIGIFLISIGSYEIKIKTNYKIEQYNNLLK